MLQDFLCMHITHFSVMLLIIIIGLVPIIIELLIMYGHTGEKTWAYLPFLIIMVKITDHCAIISSYLGRLYNPVTSRGVIHEYPDRDTKYSCLLYWIYIIYFHSNDHFFLSLAYCLERCKKYVHNLS